jgi:hypothetical protein
MKRLALPLVLAASAPAAAEEDERAAPAYGVAAAELTGAALVGLYLETSLTPGEGAGLALNFAPLVLGGGAAVLGEVADLEPAPPLAFHGGLVGGLSLFMVGAVLDGVTESDHLRIGYGALALGACGLVGGGYAGATLIDDSAETLAFAVAPLATGFAGALTFAIVHAVDDQAAIADARLVGFTGAGMLLGVAGALLYALPDRRPAPTTSSLAPTIRKHGETTLLSIGGAF